MFNSNQNYIKDVTNKALNSWVLYYLLCFIKSVKHFVIEEISLGQNGMVGFSQQEGTNLFMIN